MYILLSMETHIQKWGNSLGIRLPKHVAEKQSFVEGGRVRITETKTGVIIERVSKKSFILSEMLEKMTDENMHAEVDWGNPVGKEVW
jgi:antitoxin MazE